MQKKSTILATLRILALLSFSACSTLPPQPTLTPTEQVRVDNAVGRTLVEKLGFSKTYKVETETSRYLNQMTEAMAATVAELKETRIFIALVENADHSWRNYTLPGIKIYISAAMARSVEFETELAAALAIEIGHVLKRNLLRHILSPQQIETSRNEVVVSKAHFQFSNQEWADSIDEAVRVLYETQFDPRGIVSLLRRFEAHPEVSPIPLASLKGLIERADQAIVKFPPLKNPVVRSEAFLAFQKRVRKL